MKISHYQLRTLIESVILEGFQSDQRYLAKKYPEHSQDIFRLQPKWISWLMARFGDSPTQKEIHPFSDTIATVLNFSKKDAAIGEKWKSNEQFRNAVNSHFPEEERAWRSPADVTTMTVDQMELVLGLAERKKQRIELNDDTTSVEGDRVGKVGPWNIWLPTTRENSCKIAGYDPVTLKPQTTWCTARTSGSNLFYNYVGQSGQETTLFYIIKDNPAHDEDWLSLGFVNGKPKLSSNDGGLSVDRANKGLTKGRLISIFGPYHNEIMNIMVEKNKSLGGKHPAREKIIDATQSVEALNYLLKGLSKDEANDIKKAVLHEPNVQPDVFRVLAKDPDLNIKLYVAMHKEVPEDVLRKFAESSELALRSQVASNIKAPQDVLRKFAESSSVEIRRYVATNRGTPIDVLHKLVEDPDASVRRLVPGHPKAPKNIFYKLAEDESVDVRKFIAWQTKIPQDMLRKLAEDDEVGVRLSVAENKAIPQDILLKLSKDSHHAVRSSIATCEKTPEDVLRKLAEDPNESVRLAIMLNKKIPEDVLRKLAEDPDTQVRISVASNTKTPQDTLRKLAKNSNSFIRVNVARNANAPIDALKILANDTDERVRSYATKNIHTQRLKK